MVLKFVLLRFRMDIRRFGAIHNENAKKRANVSFIGSKWRQNVWRISGVLITLSHGTTGLVHTQYHPGKKITFGAEI